MTTALCIGITLTAVTILALHAPVAMTATADAPDHLALVAATTDCGDLENVNLTGVTGAAITITAHEVGSPGGIFCRVSGVIAPAIRFEVELPVKGWTQRYLQLGCAALCGSLSGTYWHAGACQAAATGGFVVATNDQGHQPKAPNDASWGLDPQKRIDFAYRADHLTALAAKRLIHAFYGQRPRYNYFSGCSEGGRQALVAAERYPDDFDGVAAGAPAMAFSAHAGVSYAWLARANTGSDGKAILLSGRLPILRDAALAACDRDDGLVDGLISDPLSCHFDPASIQCSANASDSSRCLSAAEVEVARKFYSGPLDPQGQRMIGAHALPGSEAGWAATWAPATRDAISRGRTLSDAALKYLLFPNVLDDDHPVERVIFDANSVEQLNVLRPLYDATDGDLARFQARGGKLILYHGWGDADIAPMDSIRFFEYVKSRLGASTVDRFARLFMVPGMFHCTDGPGFSQFDVLTPLMAWVEGRHPPQRLIAAEPAPMPPSPRQAADAVRPIRLPPPDAPALRTRPVFPYPSVAHYVGTGDANDAANFVPAPGPILAREVATAGNATLTTPIAQKWYTVRDGRLVATPRR